MPDSPPEISPGETSAAVPARAGKTLPMVGLGGSAGGIRALQEFFAAMPADSGMAFVVILHLSPEHESTLAELFQRSTAMPVLTATDGAKVEANCVYVIPPGKYLSSVDGHLRLTAAHDPRGKRVAVDVFFRTLADTHGPESVAVVLSGADGDGALGLKRIKERGGLTIAQDPDEAEHPGMPRSAIATGMVDWVLAVKEMPARLLGYMARRGGLKLPAEDGPQPTTAAPPSPDEREAALREVLAFLRTRTGRDFSYYKRATILRRIARRMRVNGLDELPAYLVYLRTHAGEAGALLQDMLISVTNFFRDAEAFAALERIVPELFKGKGPGDAVRVWVAGCATGEEAYSIAILLGEHARTLDAPPPWQVFATDLDEDVIREAREGLYPGDDRGRCERGAAAALLCPRGRRLPRAARGAQDGALCPARFAEGLAVLAARPRLMPEPAHLPEPRGAAAGARRFPFCAAARRASLPRHVRDGGGREPALRRGGQEAAPLRAAARCAADARRAHRPEHAGPRAGAPGALARAAHAARPRDGRRRVPGAGAVRHRAPRGRPPLPAHRAFRAALGARECGARDRASLGKRGPLPPIFRRRADARPAARGASDAADRAARHALRRGADAHGRDGFRCAGRDRRHPQPRRSPRHAGERSRAGVFARHFPGKARGGPRRREPAAPRRRG